MPKTKNTSIKAPIPKFNEARDFIERYRGASTEREKRKVLNSIKHKHPQIAERMAKLLS